MPKRQYYKENGIELPPEPEVAPSLEKYLYIFFTLSRERHSDWGLSPIQSSAIRDELREHDMLDKDGVDIIRALDDCYLGLVYKRRAAKEATNSP